MAVVQVTEAAAKGAMADHLWEAVERTGEVVDPAANTGAAIDRFGGAVEHDSASCDPEIPSMPWQRKRAQRPLHGSSFQSWSSSASTEVPSEGDDDKGTVPVQSWPLPKVSGLRARRNCNLAPLQRTRAEVTCSDCFAANGYSAGCVIGRSMSNHSFTVLSVTKEGRSFAAKMTSEHVGEGIMRDVLKREHGVLSRMDHHRIVRAVALVETAGGCGLVMERCSGVQLTSLLPADSALCRKGRHAVLEYILDAVSYLHRQLVAHTDLHAGNVMVDCSAVTRTGEPGAAPGVKIIDFGSARDAAAVGGDLADGLGFDIQPDIKPPECAGGVLSPFACDVFQMGLLAAGLVTGRSLATAAVVRGGAPAIPGGILRLSAAGQAHLAAMLSPLPEGRPEARTCLASLPPSCGWLAEV